MSDFSYNILFREKQLRDERLKNARAQEWDKLGCCTACGGKIGWFLKALRGDLCSNCQYNQHKQLKREEEEERKTYFEKQFYLEKKRNIPTDLTSKRLECYIEDLINEKSTVAALAFWKDESSGAE